MRDIIVIGAGGGGPIVAKELAARGIDVLVIEGGPRHAHPRTDWTHFEADAGHPLTGFFRSGPADRNKPAWFREHPQNSFIFQLSGVGGTTQHYFGNCPRAYPGCFNDYTGPDADAYDVDHLFPFGYSELVPYYEWVEATLPVATAAMGLKEERYLHGCETLGIPLQTAKTTTGASYRPQENAILQPGGNAGLTSDRNQLIFPLATGCTFCGHCVQGCMQPINPPRNLIAKRSTDNSYVPMALTAEAWMPGGRAITLITDSFVTQIHTAQVSGQTTATGVSWRENGTGAVHREDARVVVMSGGAVENPRLWFNSALPNPNGWVGRGFTDHSLDYVFGIFDDDVGNTKGTASSARCDFPGYGCIQQTGTTPTLQALLMTASDSGIRGHYTNGRGMTGTWDGPTGRTIGPELKDILMHGPDHLMNIAVITDDDVEAQNRVVLSAFPADANGPSPKVTIQSLGRTPRTIANREYLAEQAVRVLRGAGARTVIRQDLMTLGIHIHSSMRMGHSDADSVIDTNAEARWVKALFIADNSALPNAIGGPNPTLTTQAMCTRTAEKVFQLYFDGDPWVGVESPVVSTDPRISVRLAQLGL